MVTYRSVIKRYCPHVEHNVSIRICRHQDGSVTQQCLHDPDCAREYGGCKNALRPTWTENGKMVY